MKYIKKFEINIEDSIKKIHEDMTRKILDYKKYYDKYVIFEYQKDFYLAKFILIDVFDRVDLEIYEYDSTNFIFSTKRTDILTINEINVISSYDRLENAKKSYILLLDTKKFNV